MSEDVRPRAVRLTVGGRELLVTCEEGIDEDSLFETLQLFGEVSVERIEHALLYGSPPDVWRSLHELARSSRRVTQPLDATHPDGLANLPGVGTVQLSTSELLELEPREPGHGEYTWPGQAGPQERSGRRRGAKGRGKAKRRRQRAARRRQR